MTTDQEYWDAIKTIADELYRGLAEDQDIRFWEGGIVRVAPTGAPPEYITVEIEGIYDGNVRWTGVPPTLNVGDEVLVWENPNSKRREIIASSGATGVSLAHDILSVTHTDTPGAAAVVRGDLLYGDATPDWNRLAIGTQGFFIKSDGTDTGWRRISAQTSTVGPGTQDEAATLGAAVAIVNAAGPPSAANPWVIEVWGIVTAETGNVTVPQYCHVVGMAEGSTIGMGANTLSMSDDSSLLNLKITSSSGTGIDINGADCIIRNIHMIVAGTYGIHIYGDSDCQLYDVIIEGSAGCSYGIHVDGTATPLLEQCTVDDTTNFTVAALWIAIASVTVTSRFSKFHGAAGGDDVWTGAGSTWNDLASEYDAGNITVNGTYVALPHSPVNLDGRADALILDADGDTTISAPTDDQIDIEIAGTDYGVLTERVAHFTEVFEAATWYDFEIEDDTEGDHFRQNAGVYPAGWTETDASPSTNTNELFSFWYLRGTAADASWDYRLQTGITLESLAANAYASFQYGPIIYSDGGYTADLTYRFAIHGETAAAIDLNEYVRVALYWNSAASAWEVRGESRAGAADVETASAWIRLYNPPHLPLYFRLMLRNNAGVKTTREYYSVVNIPYAQGILQTVGENTTWGQLYWRITLSRGAGANDHLFLGAIDYLAGQI